MQQVKVNTASIAVMIVFIRAKICISTVSPYVCCLQKSLAACILCYWCPVNWYERPYKRRVLGKRIEGVASDGMPWKKNPLPWKKVPPPWKKVPTASISDGAADRENGVLRKKCHVVRKKTHVVRKIFYVASIFHGIRSLTNSPPHRATKGGVGVKGSGCGAQGSRLGVGRQKVRRNMPRIPHVCVPG